MFKKMINRLIGGKEVSNKIQPLIFKDNFSAFEYACKYLDTSLSANKPMPAIIIRSKWGTASFARFWKTKGNAEGVLS